jgi:peptidoglycan/xylan/chitin deacetylase (PgdA/CDA1 family)
LSFDLELIWGTLDLFGPEGFDRQCRIEKDMVIGRLLELLDELEIPATWFVVGHLFLDECHTEDGRKHPEIVRPTHAWSRGDWFQHDPDGPEEEAPTFLGWSMVRRIVERQVRHEIGAHSFSHVIFGDPGCSRDTAASEVAACVAVARARGLEVRSFAFPRNRVGHLDVLAEQGFRCYRGPEPRWYNSPRCPALLSRVAHIWDFLRIAAPPVVVPHRRGGLCSVPGSMILLPMHGLRRHIPASWRVARARKGLAAAVEQSRVFHLWMHPTNLVDSMEEMIGCLRSVLEEVVRLRAEGRLVTRTVAGAAADWGGGVTGGRHDG